MEEKWKEITNYEGLYQVSNLGRIRNRHNRIMKQQEQRYCKITLSKNNNSHTYNVHRLVAEAFIPNPDNLPEVNHKDENKLNNSVDNLEWCDRAYNNTYGTRIERSIPKMKESLKGRVAWNKGIPMEQSVKDKISKAQKERYKK